MAAQPGPAFVMPSPAINSTFKVIILVGDRQFKSTFHTLSESGYFKDSLIERAQDPTPLDTSQPLYDLDVAEDVFEKILDYLRSRVLPVFHSHTHGHDEALYSRVLAQAKLFRIPRLVKWIEERKYLDAVVVSYTAMEEIGVEGLNGRSSSNLTIERYPSWSVKRRYVCAMKIPAHDKDLSLCGPECKTVEGKIGRRYVEDRVLQTLVVWKEVIFDHELCVHWEKSKPTAVPTKAPAPAPAPASLPQNRTALEKASVASKSSSDSTSSVPLTLPVIAALSTALAAPSKPAPTPVASESAPPAPPAPPKFTSFPSRPKVDTLPIGPDVTSAALVPTKNTASVPRPSAPSTTAPALSERSTVQSKSLWDSSHAPQKQRQASLQTKAVPTSQPKPSQTLAEIKKIQEESVRKRLEESLKEEEEMRKAMEKSRKMEGGTGQAREAAAKKLQNIHNSLFKTKE